MNNIFKYTSLDAINLEKIDHSYIYNNTFYGVNSVKTGNTIQVNYQGGCTNMVLKNNIFYGTGNPALNSTALCLYIPTTTDETQLEADYNLYYQVYSNEKIISFNSGGSSYTMAQWAALKSATGWEAHSPAPADPKFVSATDFHLQSGSPAIGAGISIPEVCLDFEGSPVSDPSSLGCFTSQSVTVPTPVYASSVIENTTPSILDMTYNLSLVNVVPAVSAFSVQVNSVNRSISTVTITGGKVRLTLSGPVVYGDVIKISYTKPSANPLQTSSGGQAASISLQPVTNNVLAVSPVYVSSVIGNDASNLLIITYDLSLANKIPPVSSFKVVVNGFIVVPIVSVAIEDNMVKLLLTRKIRSGDKVTLSYTKPLTNSNSIQTPFGSVAISFSLLSVTNKVIGNFNSKGEDVDLFSQNVTIYPNPAHEYLNISFTETYLSPIFIKIFNSAGSIVSQELIEPENNSVQISIKFPSGIYFVRFISEGISLGTQKLIVQ